MFFLYYSCGRCQQGDHSSGFEEFDTLAEAEKRLKEVWAQNAEGTARIVNGESVESRDW